MSENEYVTIKRTILRRILDATFDNGVEEGSSQERARASQQSWRKLVATGAMEDVERWSQKAQESEEQKEARKLGQILEDERHDKEVRAGNFADPIRGRS